MFLPPLHADDWGGLATISTTMGINEGRLCLGESTRGDLGCPAYAPYVNRTTGFVGFGTNSPNAELDVLGTVSATTANIAGAININTSGPTKWAIIKRSETYLNSQPNNLVFSFNNGAIWTQTLDLTSTGQMGVGVSQPSTSLQVRGSMRVSTEASTTLQTCDANRTGAIKYQSGDFHLCRNGTSWESLTSLTGGGGSAGDRITSGTTGMYTYTTGKASIATNGTERIVVSATGLVGIGQQPQSGMALAVSGTSYATTLQLADNPANPCNATNKGMAKVIDGRIYVCRYP